MNLNNNSLTIGNMIIVMQKSSTEEQVQRIIRELEEKGLQPQPLIGTERTVIAVIGDERLLDERHFRGLPGVSKVMTVLQPFKLASRDTKHEDTIVNVSGVEIGGKELVVMAGPCSVEGHEQLLETAKAVKAAGAKILRGGAFKPRTSPHSFQGMGEEGLKIMKAVSEEVGIPTVTETLDPRHVELVEKYVDMFQIGARNMQNFELLKEVGKTQTPVLLKRGPSSTIQEFILAAEYIMKEGNLNVVLCERGIKTFETDTRNTLPLATVPLIKEMSHLPIIVDPSHGTGRRSFIKPMSLAGVAAGADGLMIEVHPNPDEAWTDGDQSITPQAFEEIMKAAKPVAGAVDRTL